MKIQLSEKLYERAKWAILMASLQLIAGIALSAAGIMTLANDGFIGWLLCSLGAIALGLCLMQSARAVRLTHYAMAEEEAEWRRALQPFRL